jgi:signal transduction histidine kinase
MDGIQLVKQVQSVDKQIFCVFVTAYQDRSVDSINDILGLQNIDRWDYINKPFTEGEIVQKARMVTKLYHLQRIREWQEEQLGQAHQFVMENERMATVAAVGRSVAHEFGNLLMQIVGHADIALMKGDTERMKQALETILKASDTATAVLGRFKKMASHGDFTIEKKPLNLILTLNESLELMSYQFRNGGVTLKKVKMDSVLVEANHHALVQVLMNLFINAVHAMPEGGEIEVTCVRIPSGAEIRVRDHGIGIPPDLILKVTEPLFTTKGSQGTGLGLAIAKEIVEIEHQGEFIIQNHPEKGVEAILRIPTRQPDHLAGDSGGGGGGGGGEDGS